MRRKYPLCPRSGDHSPLAKTKHYKKTAGKQLKKLAFFPAKSPYYLAELCLSRSSPSDGLRVLIWGSAGFLIFSPVLLPATLGTSVAAASLYLFVVTPTYVVAYSGAKLFEKIMNKQVRKDLNTDMIEEVQPDNHERISDDSLLIC